MDNKAKIHFKNPPVTTIAIICILLLSIGMLCIYPIIHRRVDRYKNDALGSGELSGVLIEANYALYSQLIGKELIYQEFEGSTDENENIDIATEWFNNLARDYMSIEYMAIDHTTKNIKSNIRNIDDKLKEDLLTRDMLEQQYEFYVLMEYDKGGNLSILFDSINGDSVFKYNLLSQEQAIKQVLSEEGISQIKDTTYFYGITEGNFYMDQATWEIESSLEIGYREVMKGVLGWATALVIIGAAAVPYKYIIRSKWINKVYKVPLELLVSGMGVLIIVQIDQLSRMIKKYEGSATTEGASIFLILNLLIWFTYFISIMTSTWILKSMYQQGIREYLMKHTLVGMGYRSIKLRLIRKVEGLSHTHFEELEPRKLKKFIVINGLVLCGLCCIWVLGIIGVVIYMISMYWFLNKIVSRVKYYYEKLLDTTWDLARGELDTQISEEDIGAFEPLKLHIEKIQQAFRKSVEEELRSQKIKTDLITNVSHDLRTPLTSIISYIDLLKQENLSDKTRKEYIDILDRKSLRLQTLIEDLFEISKASSGSIKLNIEQVDVVALIKQTLFELEDRIQASNISFRTNFPESKVYLQLDGLRSFRIFDNLINNIIKYGMPHSRAYIELEEMPHEVVIVFKNTAREELKFDAKHITERFVRGDVSRKTEGSGLGLAIAKSFVELQAGSFKVEIDGDLFKVIIRFKKLN